MADADRILDGLKLAQPALTGDRPSRCFQDSEFQTIATAAPRDRDSLRTVIKPEKADKYALELLELVAHKLET